MLRHRLLYDPACPSSSVLSPQALPHAPGAEPRWLLACWLPSGFGVGGISKPGDPKEGGVFIPQAPLVRTSAVSLPRRLKLFLAALSSGRGSSVSQLQDWWWTRFLPGSPALAHSPSTDYPQPHHPRALPHFSWILDGWSLLGLFHFPHHTTFSEASVPQRSHCPSVVCSPQDIAWDSFPPEAGMIADKPMSSKCSPSLRNLL